MMTENMTINTTTQATTMKEEKKGACRRRRGRRSVPAHAGSRSLTLYASLVSSLLESTSFSPVELIKNENLLVAESHTTPYLKVSCFPPPLSLSTTASYSLSLIWLRAL